MKQQFFNEDILDVPIEDESVHLIITSPPYNVGINYDKHEDNKPYQEYLSWLTEVFVHLKKKLVNGGRLCINIAPTGIKKFTPIHHDLITNLRNEDYNFVGEILWYKQNMKSRTAWGSFRSPRRPYVLPSWEYIYVLQKGTFLENGESKKEFVKPDITSDEFVRFSDGFWNISPETAKKGHPVPFPEQLIYRLIKLYSYPGNTVLDPFGGSGTVAAVCAKNGRNSVYVDISQKYHEMAQNRVANLKSKCPYCKSEHYIKDGKRRDQISKPFEDYTGLPCPFLTQRYRCKSCKKQFTHPLVE
ncbi:MAG: DNA methyltransferase [Methanoregulaceae archaeon]|jgi:DNA modification methylase